VKRNLQTVGVDDAAIVAECFESRRLVVRRDERQTADFEQLRCREEHHVRREIEDGVDENPLLHEHVVEPLLLGGNRGCQAGRTRAHDQDITDRHVGIL
jgi:hypothetical protein